jgi:hypothetical protein
MNSRVDAFLQDSAWFSPAQLAFFARSCRDELGSTSPLKVFAARSDLIGDGPHEVGDEARARLELVARPSGWLRIIETPGEATPRILNVFIRGDIALRAVVDRKGFGLGCPISVVEMIEALSTQIAGPSKQTGTGGVYLTTHLRLLTAIWRGTGKGVADLVSKQAAIDCLTRAGLDKADAEIAVRSLVGACVVENRQQLRLDDRLKHWAARLWSGQFVEFQYYVFPNGRDAPLPRPKQILFAGVPDMRCVCTGRPLGTLHNRYRLGGGAQLSGIESQRVAHFFEVSRVEALCLMRRFFSPTNASRAP